MWPPPVCLLTLLLLVLPRPVPTRGLRPLPTKGAGAGPSPGTVPAALGRSSAAIAGLGPQAPSSAPLWEGWHCVTPTINGDLLTAVPAASVLCLARSAFLPASRCPASLGPRRRGGALVSLLPWGGTPWLCPCSPGSPLLVCLLLWGRVTDSRAFQGPRCMGREGCLRGGSAELPPCQETRWWECAVSSDLSIFQKKLEIQIVCV